MELSLIHIYLRRMEEQEEGIFSEIKNYSEDIVMEECTRESKINQVVDKKVSESNIGSGVTNNQSNIAEVIVLGE